MHRQLTYNNQVYGQTDRVLIIVPACSSSFYMGGSTPMLLAAMCVEGNSLLLELSLLLRCLRCRVLVSWTRLRVDIL
jgi:hypothetical protein